MHASEWVGLFAPLGTALFSAVAIGLFRLVRSVDRMATHLGTIVEQVKDHETRIRTLEK